MEALGLLAGGVAHDLNNVLSGIVSYPELLLLDLPDNSPLRDPVMTIQRSGQRAAEIVQDLLTLARRGVVSIAVMNINRMVSEYLDSPEFDKLTSHHPTLQIETRLRADLLDVNGSAIHIKKTIMNLVSNAAEAHPRGGNILISTENRYVDRRIEGYDNVKAGEYAVLSVEGQGTRFELYFPATRKQLAADKAAVPMDAYTGNGETILIVDDVKEQRVIASGILGRLNYRPVSVASGEGAVDYLDTHGVDLVLLDMVMDPGMDGIDTYRRIRGLHPEQKAIIASGFSETERVKTAIELGVRQYIRKPYTIEKIGVAVKRALRQQTAMDADR